MKILSSLAVVAFAMIALAGPVSAAPHTGNPGGNCDGFDGPNKVNTTDGSIVLPAGTLVCIKAGDSNTGTLTADGVSTLAEMIEASGLVNNGGQVPNVSNYVTYPATPTPTPEPTPTPTPTATPELPTPTPTDSQVDTGGSNPTTPPTDTLTGEVKPTPPIGVFVGLGGIFVLSLLSVLARRRR